MTPETSPFHDIHACVFDAYGTLLDVASAARRCEADLGGKAVQLADIWRAKQLQYTWLRSLMGRHADFRRVTEDSLDFALDTLGIADAALRAKLLELYEVLDAYPEVPAMLAALHAGDQGEDQEKNQEKNMKTAILSNGSPDMLAAAVSAAGIGGQLDAVLSIEDVGIYKPDPRVYQLAVDRLGVAKEHICFVSSNGWDAAGAAAFGFQVAWVNRGGQAPERLEEAPLVELRDLTGLADLVFQGSR